MLDVQLQPQRAMPGAGFVATLANPGYDPHLPFALTMPVRDPGAICAGEAGAAILDRFARLPDAMDAAVMAAAQLDHAAPGQVLAILDRDSRLVLAGVAEAGAVAWCQPVLSAPEARQVVREASALRAQASRAAEWNETDLARRLRHRAELLEARLVDPLWRNFVARVLQCAA